MKNCIIDGCQKPQFCRGWCKTHYHRWSRHGDPLVLRKLPNRTYEVCQFEGCEEPHQTRGWCRRHYARWMRHGDPNISLQPRLAHPSYKTVHKRVRRTKGAANQHLCSHCLEQAAQWAYDHTDPAESRSDDGPYSTDVDRYIPLCTPCHKRFDLGVLA